ncbi:glucose-1-phosphate cytidylyltransferase [Belnapia sp. T6]|uniref:Glucose-1-phosphate cytidylyltransferase n=1 Tax=Belnapia mucosa TaxID=2804532 RepID=A0ABS1V5J6_9PROT|nr:glucose-1-phosphate cytidylyltransferase [Belnapia mucosa]MBL6455573.1 glucose-1-phosphate cytidylyltransferase [Belnapia mucosa]
MKAVILAGGLGTRLSEETELRPKPMVEIGGRPILWHIMKIFGEQGVRDFVICLGYKGYMVKEYFINYRRHVSDITVDLASGSVETHRSGAEDWRISLIETGDGTMTGGRLKRVGRYLGEDDFFMTYGDGLADIDLAALHAAHRAAGRLATVTAVRPSGRFGALELEADRVAAFREKPAGDGGTINGGFFLLSPRVLDLIEGDDTTWEAEPMERLARDGQLTAYQHRGFWQPMDTLRDRRQLEALWAGGQAPWKRW